MRFFTAAVAALAFGAAAALSPVSIQPAQAQSALLNDFTAENVSAVLTELGATNIKTSQNDGITFLNFELGGLPQSYSIRLCNLSAELGPGCLGLLMAIGFETPDKINLDVFNSFNRKWPLATSVKIDDKTMALGRFIFSPGGVSRENLKANIALLMGAPEAFNTHLKSQLVASLELSQPTFTHIGTGGAFRSIRLSPQQLVQFMDDKAVKYSGR